VNECGPSGAQVRTFQDELRKMMGEIEHKAIENPLLLDQHFSYTPPASLKVPENPGHVAIRKLNWERRVKRLKKDWYSK